MSIYEMVSLGWFALKQYWIATLICFVVVGVIWLAYLDALAWEQFVVDNECVVIGRIAATSHTGTGITYDGKVGMVTTHTAAKTTWKCSDGVTYTR